MRVLFLLCFRDHWLLKLARSSGVIGGQSLEGRDGNTSSKFVYSKNNGELHDES